MPARPRCRFRRGVRSAGELSAVRSAADQIPLPARTPLAIRSPSRLPRLEKIIGIHRFPAKRGWSNGCCQGAPIGANVELRSRRRRSFRRSRSLYGASASIRAAKIGAHRYYLPLSAAFCKAGVRHGGRLRRRIRRSRRRSWRSESVMAKLPAVLSAYGGSGKVWSRMCSVCRRQFAGN